MDDSLIFKLGLNTEEFKASLENAQKVVDNLANALATLSNKKIALNVKITNTDFNSVFRRLNNEIKTSDRSAKELSEELDNLFSGKSYQKGFQKTFKDLNDSISNLETKLSNLFSDANTKGGFTRTFTKTVANAVSKGIEQGIENAFTSNKNKTDLTSKIQRLFSSETSTEGNALVKDLADLANQFENIKRNITSGLASTFREIKTQYPELADMNGSEMLKFFSKNADMLTPGQRHWSQREIAADVGKNAARAFQEEMKDKDVQNALVFTEEFAKEMSKATQKLASVPTAIENSVRGIDDVIDAKTKQTQAQAKIAESRARVQAAKEEDYFESRLSKQEKAARRERNYNRDMKTATEMYRAEYATDDKTASAQRGYIQAMAHIRTLAEQARQGNYPTLNTLISAQNQRQKASITLNNRLLSDQLGLDKMKAELKAITNEFSEWGTKVNKVANIMMNVNQAMGNIQNIAHNITFSILNQARNITYRLSYAVRSMLSEATDAYKSLETSMIGFTNFFGEEKAKILYQQIKDVAAIAPGLGTADLAEYVRQIAPVSGGNDQLALNASLGMLKTIQYGGANGSTEMEYVIKNVRDVLAKGKATQIDLRQFNRAMPVLEKVLSDIGESDLIKDGKLNITKDNVNTILSAFAKLNTAENSPVAGIYDTLNKTLSGQWEQFTEQLTTNLMGTLQRSGAYGTAQHLLSKLNDGLYVQNALARLGDAIANLISKVNWFTVQRYASYIGEAFGIIGQAIKELYQDVVGYAKGVDFHDILIDGARAIGEFIKSMGGMVKQVISIVNRLLDSGIVNFALKLAPATTAILKFQGIFLTFTQNITKALGSASQLLSDNIQSRYSRLIASREGLFNLVPNAVKANSTNLRIGKDAAGNVYTLGQDYEGFAGTGVIHSIDKNGNATKVAEYANYANAQKQFNSMATEISGTVNKTLKSKLSSGLIKIERFALKAINGFAMGLNALSITESVSSVVEALNLFGTTTTTIANVVRAVGYSIAGSLVGSSIGSSFGTIGGVVGKVAGALTGFALGVASIVKSIKDKENELNNTKVSETLDEADKAMYDQVVNTLKEYGYDVNKETTVGKGALDQLAYYIKSTPVANRSTEEAVQYYLTALKNLSVGYGLDNFVDNQLKDVGGSKLDFSQYGQNTYVTKLADLVRKYGLAEGNGWEYSWDADKNANTYVDENGVAIPAEEVLKAAFPNGVTDKQAEEILKKANELEETNAKTTTEKFDTMIRDNVKFKSALDNIDANVKKIVAKMGIDPSDRKPLSDENLSRLYGSEYAEAANNWEGRRETSSFLEGGFATDLALGDTYNMRHLISAFHEAMNQAEDEGDEDRAGWLWSRLQDLIAISKGEAPSGYSEPIKNLSQLRYWVLAMKDFYKQLFNKTLTYASGGTVPAYRSVGIDTVPAMLAPGEFVMKQSSVRKAGLGALYALNRGDIKTAAGLLSRNVSTNAWNRNNTSTYYDRRVSYNTNNINVTNRSASGRLNSYYALANRLSF